MIFSAFVVCLLMPTSPAQISTPNPDFSSLIASADPELRRAGIAGAIFQVLQEPVRDIAADALANYYSRPLRNMSTEDWHVAFKLLRQAAASRRTNDPSEYELIGRLFLIVKRCANLKSLALEPFAKSTTDAEARLALYAIAHRWDNKDQALIRKLINSTGRLANFAREAMEFTGRVQPSRVDQLLNRAEDPQALKKLAELATNADANTRSSALRALVRLAMAPSKGQEQLYKHHTAAQKLTRIGAPTVEPLFEYLDSFRQPFSPNAAYAAGLACGVLHGMDFVALKEIGQRMVKHGRLAKLTVVNTASYWGPPGQPLLIELAGDTDVDIRKAAWYQLERQ